MAYSRNTGMMILEDHQNDDDDDLRLVVDWLWSQSNKIEHVSLLFTSSLRVLSLSMLLET